LGKSRPEAIPPKARSHLFYTLSDILAKLFPRARRRALAIVGLGLWTLAGLSAAPIFAQEAESALLGQPAPETPVPSAQPTPSLKPIVPKLTPIPTLTPTPRPRIPMLFPESSAQHGGTASGQETRSNGVSKKSEAEKGKDEKKKETPPDFEELQIGLVKDVAVIRGGCWTPVRLVLSNPEGEDFQGEIRVGFEGLTPTFQAAEADLPKGSRKRWEFLVRAPNFDTSYNMPFVAELRDSSGVIVRRLSSELLTPSQRAEQKKKGDFIFEGFEEVYDLEQAVALVVSPQGNEGGRRHVEAAGFDAYTLPYSDYDDPEPLQLFETPKNSSGDENIWLAYTASARGVVGSIQSFVNNAPYRIRQIGDQIRDIGSLLRDQEGSERFRTHRENLINRFNRYKEELSKIENYLPVFQPIARRFQKRQYQAAPGVFIARQEVAAPLQREIPGGLATPLREVGRSWSFSPSPEPDLKRRTSRFASRYYHEGIERVSGYFASQPGQGSQPFYQPSFIQASYGKRHYDRAERWTFPLGSVELLPTHPLGYNGVDVVIWEEADPESLSAEQGRALMQWVRAGGRLIICGGARASWLGSWFEDIAPANLSQNAAQFRFPLVRPAKNPAPNPWKLLGGVEVQVRELLPKPNAETVVRLGERVLAVRGQLGGGIVLATAYSLGELGGVAGSSVQDVDFFDLHFPANPSRADFRLHAASASAMREAARGRGGAPLVSVDGAFLLGIAFFILSVGANAWLARRLKKPLLFWAVFAGLSFLATGLAAWVYRNQGSGPMVVRHFAWLSADAGSPVARGTSFAAVEARLPARILPRLEGVSVPPLYFTVSEAANYELVRMVRGLSGDATHSTMARRLSVWEGGQRSRPEPHWLGFASVSEYGANYLKDLDGTIDAALVAASAPGESNKLRIENNTPHRLVRAVLYEDPNNVYIVGDLPAGQSRSISLKSYRKSFHDIQNYQNTSNLMVVVRDGFSSTEELERLRQAPELNRLAPWREDPDEKARRRRPSVIRALLGINNENREILDSFQMGARRLNIQGGNLGYALPASDEDALVVPADSFYLPADPPADEWTLVAEIESEKPLVTFESGVAGAAREGLQVLSVRIPKTWLFEERRGGYSLRRSAPAQPQENISADEAASPAATPPAVPSTLPAAESAPADTAP
jgi:hypothetical protein